MTKLLRMMAMVGAFITLQVAQPRTEMELHCSLSPETPRCESSYHEIICTWDVEDDCANQEPAYDLCQNTCIECPSGAVDFGATGGNACTGFNCVCLPW